MDFQQTWREQIQERLARFADSARAEFKYTAPYLLYGFLSGMTLWPVAEAMRGGDLAGPILALGGIVGSVGANLIANQVQNWKDEADAAEQLSQTAQSDPDVREVLDALLDKLKVVEQAQAGMSDQDRAWFLETLHREVAQLGSSLTIGSDVVYGDKVGRDKVARDKVVVSTHMRDMHGGTVITAERVEFRAEPTGDDLTLLEASYLRRVQVSCNALPLAVIDPRAVERTRQQTMDLLAMYVALDTQTRITTMFREIRPGTALEITDHDRKMVLLGGPGSGKSTFADYLALCLAGARLEHLAETSALPGDEWLARLEPAWTHGPLLPLQVILRHFARSDWCDGTAAGLWNFG